MLKKSKNTKQWTPLSSSCSSYSQSTYVHPCGILFFFVCLFVCSATLFGQLVKGGLVLSRRAYGFARIYFTHRLLLTKAIHCAKLPGRIPHGDRSFHLPAILFLSSFLCFAPFDES